MKILAIALLCAPLWIILLVAVFYFIPGISTFVSNVFWEMLGDRWNIFALAQQMMKSMSGANKLEMSSFFSGMLSLMLNAALDAVFIGCIIFLVQSTSVTLRKVKRNGNKFYYHILGRPKWISSLVGVCIAVALDSLFGLGPKSLSFLLKSFASVIVMIVGFVLIFKAGNGATGKYKNQRFQEDRTSFLWKLAVAVIVNGFKAIAVVNLITFVMEGATLLRNGAHLWPLITWFASSALLMLVCNLLDGKT